MTSSRKTTNPPYLGVDWGSNRFGISVSPDGEHVFSRDHITVASQQDALSKIATLIQNEKIQTVILGFPISLSGEEGEMSEKIKGFAHELTQRVNVDIDFWDERLTTHTARQMKNSGSTASKDSLSAMVLLQSYLGI